MKLKRRIFLSDLFTNILIIVALIAVGIVIVFTITGCDEGMNMAGDVMGGEPAEVVDTKPDDPAETDAETPPKEVEVTEEEPENGGLDPITTMGEIKQPEDTANVDVVIADPVIEDEPTDLEEATPELPDFTIWSDPTVLPKLSGPMDPTKHGYRDGYQVSDIVQPGTWILDFPGPYREHSPPESNPTDFVGRVCMPVAGSVGLHYEDWSGNDYVAPVEQVTVTVTQGARSGEQTVTDEGGYFLFPNVEGDDLYLRVEREWLEPKEVIVYRSRPTELQALRPNEVFNPHLVTIKSRSVPGMILVGLRWPDKVRFIYETELMPHDVLFALGPNSPGTGGISASYENNHVVSIYDYPSDEGTHLWYYAFAHELAHARQHAVVILNGGNDVREWVHTPEAQEYKIAWERDKEEIPPEGQISAIDQSGPNTLLENNAEACEYYWEIEIGSLYHVLWSQHGMHIRAPNRWKWCRKYLNHQIYQYDD